MIVGVADPELEDWVCSRVPSRHACLTLTWGEVVLFHRDGGFDRLCPASVCAFCSVWVIVGVRVDDGTVEEDAILFSRKRTSKCSYQPWSE